MILRELLDRPELGLYVVAAEPDALQATVRNGYITDLPDPARFLSDGDLVLTSGLWLARPDGAQRFVDAVAATHAAAIVLGTIEIGVVPTEVIERCRATGVTLLTIASGVSFRDVAATIADAQPSSPKELASRSTAFRDRLTAVLSQGGGLDALLGLAEDILGPGCWVVDERGTVVAGSPAQVQVSGALWNQVVATGLPRGSAGSPGDVATGFRIGDEQAAGMLGAAGEHRPEDDDLTVEIDGLLGALRVELELARRWRRARGEQAADLVKQIAAHEASPGAISARLRLEQLDPQAQTVPIAARTDDRHFPVAAVVALLERVAEAQGLRVLSAEDDGSALLLVNGEVSDAWINGLAGLRDAEADSLLGERQLLLGVGDVITGVSRLGSSLQTATARLEAAAGDPDSPVVVATAVHVSGYRALLQLLGEGTRRGFADEVLAPILEYDRRHDAVLLPTLRAFLEGDGAWQETARVLHLHPNTLRYRMARIRELTGRDVARIGDRVDLFLALACLDE